MSKLAVALTVILAALTLTQPAHADDYKIGVLHVERILQQSASAKAAHDRIEQEFKGRDADISRKEQEVRDTAAQLAAFILVERPTWRIGGVLRHARLLDGPTVVEVCMSATMADDDWMIL